MLPAYCFDLEMIRIYSWLLRQLQAEYEQLRVIKESPRSSIYLIRHRTSGQKFILRRFSGSGEVYEQLLGISCQNLPQVYEAAFQDGSNLVVEEYVQGDTLDFLLRDVLFTQDETRQIVTQVCRALWVLHSMDAVHRDVKPENVILRGDQAVLIDFDAARLHKNVNTCDTQILGTVGYAAPEQYGLSQTNVRTDIYAVGVLINFMLTGQHPSRKLAPGRFGRVVLRCTAVNPQKRYPNVLRLMEALE
jgi:serine/threonine protein kinase